MPGKKKQEIITFKVDEALSEVLKSVPNRSEFIRAAILTAMDNICPLCMGSGILTPDQRKHWENFTDSHTLEECENCHAFHLVCQAIENRD
ncbi:MAG: hypothetical protein P9X24_11385 [Candidatus Hatepunaea meridiana]|nr:hypothetical protein [Candidatus Hatepunaea meridiana]